MELNRLDLYGTVTTAPTTTFTGTGHARSDLTLTVSLPQDPATQLEVPVHLTGELAQLAGQHLRPGDGVIVWGPLTRSPRRRNRTSGPSVRLRAHGFLRTQLSTDAGMAFNRVNLYGQLIRDPWTQPSTHACSLLLVVPVPGQRHEVVTIQVHLAGNLARHAATTLHAKTSVLVWGYLGDAAPQHSGTADLQVVGVGLQAADATDSTGPHTGPAGAAEAPRTAVGQALHRALRTAVPMRAPEAAPGS